MDLGLKGKLALVTGGSRGIGRAIVETLAEEGCDVLVVSRQAAEDATLASSAARTGRVLVPFSADLATLKGVTDTAEFARREFGRLDLLVNNAGSARRVDFFDLSEGDWHDGFALKFFGYVRMTRELWPLLKVARGTLINIIGVSAHTPEAVYAIAASTNAALLAFTKSMAAIGERDGVRVNAVNPGQIETERLRGVLQNMGGTEQEARAKLLQQLGARRFGRPRDVAAMVAFLASDQADYVHGASVDVDGGRTRGL
jgi:3-oxoacyl-[acyl-carrier protein] reductase